MKKAWLVGVCMLAFGMTVAQNVVQHRWFQTGDRNDYAATASGDARTEQGAHVAISASTINTEHADTTNREDQRVFGGMMVLTDATPYRGRRVSLQAILSAHDATQGALIFIGAHNGSQSLVFVNTNEMPVTGNQVGVERMVDIDVPEEATTIRYGVTMVGKGAIAADRIRLGIGAPTRQVDPQIVLNAAIKIVRDKALHSGDIDWTIEEPRIRAMAYGAKTSRDVYPAIIELLKQLNDHHSMFLPPEVTRSREVQAGAAFQPVIAVKANGVGYISMPHFIGSDIHTRTEFASNMVQQIAALAPRVRCGWVVDLRQDSGGSMLPMLWGLHPFLGDRDLGYFRDAKGHLTPWKVSDGANANTPLTKGPVLTDTPVAVLTGPHTASSGEIVVLSFKLRDNTRSFGQPTAGLSTGNTLFPLPDGSSMQLTTVVDEDRAKHPYGGAIAPDQSVVNDAASDRDATLDAAMAWLTHDRHCANE